MKKLLILSFFLVPFSFSRVSLFADETFEDYDNSGYIIDYYGVISDDLDSNMSTMISNLYYTQLSEIPNFSIYDRRVMPKNTVPSSSEVTSCQNYIFYTEIVKNEKEEKWSLFYIIIEKAQKRRISKKKEYDSFYKILMESKNELETSVKELIAKGESSYSGNSVISDYDDNSAIFPSDEIYMTDENDNSSKKEDTKENTNNESSPIAASDQKLKIKSVEILSGTWQGEPYVDKIVILRGGRGFIIFNNGASMNISVTVEEKRGEQKIIIKQKGNSNASFYPDIPRKTALAAAVSAPPIQWTMILSDNMVMEGLKTTLVQNGDSFQIGEVPVSWYKVN